MDKKLNLVEILKDCPIGWKLYTPLFGEVVFKGINNNEIYPIATINSHDKLCEFTKEGFYYTYYADVECLLFPSAEQRDWSKFKTTWYKKKIFDPKSLKPFDKVLVRDSSSVHWRCSIFSHIETEHHLFPYITVGGSFSCCIPYNEDTKHLVGTKDEPSNYYKYWND